MNQAIERLGLAFIERHPERAAASLERLDPAAVRRFLASAPPKAAAAVLMRLNPSVGRSARKGLTPARIGEIAAVMSIASGADLLRQLSGQDRAAAMQLIEGERLRALTRVIEFPTDTVGAMMDPAYPACSIDQNCGAIVEELRRGCLKGITSVYALDRMQCPIGVIRTHDLFLSEADDRVSSVIHRCHFRIHGRTDWHTLTGNPDLRQWNALPVVDDENRYIGAFREETILGLIGDSAGDREVKGVRRTSLALGEVFRLGLSGILDTIDDSSKGTFDDSK